MDECKPLLHGTAAGPAFAGTGAGEPEGPGAGGGAGGGGGGGGGVGGGEGGGAIGGGEGGGATGPNGDESGAGKGFKTMFPSAGFGSNSRNSAVVVVDTLEMYRVGPGEC